MEDQRGVPAALRDHDYWRREPSTSQAPRGRRRRREQEHRSLGERPRRRPRLDAAVQSSGPLSSASVSFSGPQVSSVPQPSASGQVRATGEGQRYMEPVGLSPTRFGAVVEMFMGWITDSPYNPEM
ncbi:hypothetical protein E3U43_005561 [Larimichthys crocea]|uniref:Uncharacterized protein n=1 Tax=Larimichthys crocea TaxID=215358 RepID=A0ACD3QNK2_LARCR|nr:hypothetical protein E3U43_005561 [Larimichthys crocea]